MIYFFKNFKNSEKETKLSCYNNFFESTKRENKTVC